MTVARLGRALYALAVIVVAITALYFVMAGLEKLHDPIPLARAIQRHGLVQVGSSAWVSVLGASELAVGVMLLTSMLSRRIRPIGYLVAAAVLTVFTAYLVLLIAERGPRIDCGCSGILPLDAGWALVRNGVFLSGVLWAFHRAVARSAHRVCAPAAGEIPPPYASTSSLR